MLFKKETSPAGQVIIDEQVVSLADLKRSASRANTRFWSLTLGVALISSMALPYMSIAATIPSGTSEAFTGQVAPGYSMGGVKVSAYGIDLNSWGFINKDRVVGSDYGIWSKNRLTGAASNLGAHEGKDVFLLGNQQSANYNLKGGEKAEGWQMITGRSSYSLDNPDGYETSTQSTQTDTVAPYRTRSDYNFWDNCLPTSNGNASASISVSIFADFVIVGVDDDGRGQVLGSPDDVEAANSDAVGRLWGSGKDGGGATGAVPYYVSLRDLFDGFGSSGSVDLSDPKDATITNLLYVIANTQDADKKLGDIAKKSNLIGEGGTHYTSLNSDKVSESSDAFNPYPYTMVFSKKTDNGVVVSSLYNNSEAYVYFSPASAYSQYMQLRTEFEEIKAASTSEINNRDAVKTVQLGYYLAEMAILEAYLDEALPQDMTRGYVGPSEPSNIADSNLAEGATGVIAGDGASKATFGGSSASDFRGTSYATIMYDVVRSLGGADGSDYKLGETSAIMDTLSVFGYNSSTSVTTGVMKGLQQDELITRCNMFTPYRASKIEVLTSVQKAREKKSDESSSGSSGSSGSSSSSSSSSGASGGDSGGGSDASGYATSRNARKKWLDEHKSSFKIKAFRRTGRGVTGWMPSDDSSYGFAYYHDGKDVRAYQIIEAGQGASSPKVSDEPLSGEETAKLIQEINAANGWSAGLTIEKTTISISSAGVDDNVETTTVDIPQAYGPFDNWFKSLKQVASQIGSAASKKASLSPVAGLYIPPYYPIQQHKMPASEKVYRFQIISAIPYSVLLEYIKNEGFSEGVALTYSSRNTNGLGIDSFTSISDAEDKRAALAASYEMAEKSELAQGLYLSDVVGKGGAEGGSLSDGKTKDDKGKEETASGRTVKNTMVSLYGGSGFSTDDLSYTIDEKDDKTKKKTVTAARIDAALIGYAASSMTADNVHDLFDVVRSTIGLKQETYLRFYNPIKSEGGDTDLFVTRVSPALTTYLPAILVNGYTAAGGTAIQPALTTVNCSFDYYSTPSFAPCFASHTSDDCYYGVLNYEQRAFYSSGFIKTLSETAGIPSVQAYMDLQEAMEDMNSEAAQENNVMWKDVLTLYVMAKRYAYIKACNLMATGTPLSGQSYFDAQFNWGRLKDNGGESYMKSKKAEYEKLGLTDSTTISIKSDCINTNMNFDDGLVLESCDWDCAGKIKAWHDGCNPLDIPGGNGGKVDGDDVIKSDYLLFNGEKPADGEIYQKYFITAFYKSQLNSLLGEGGSYYWEPIENVKKKAEEMKDSIVVAKDGKFDKAEVNKYSVAFSNSWLQAIGISKKRFDNQEIISGYEQVMKEAAENITNAVINMAKDMKLLQSAMPSQMQNCLAWADYQNSSDSEAQFESDPSQTNVTINMTEDDGNDIDTDKIQSSGITNRQSLAQYGFELVESENGEGDEQTIGNLKLNNGANVNDELQSKMTRGVEGSTWTSTTQPAEYTMSATIARVDTMANETGTTYPYSGLASGRLQSGTDQYAVMQSHVIDYTSIASGIAGDLATRQRAKVVAITNPEYSGITDFLNIIGNIGAFFGELGKSMLNAASGAFSDMFFTTTGTSSKTNSNTAGQEVTGTGTTQNKAATMVYPSAGGITMNRLPASANVFNADTGGLNQKPLVNSGSATAGAAGVSAVRAFGFLMLTGGSGLYSILQTIGLTLVMVFIGFIAFRNFYAYALANNTAMIQAQMQLKVVLPRSILAIFMIGLPPMAGSMGFEGGNFILLSLITNVMNFIGDIFFSLNGSAIMSVFDIDLVSSFGMDIFAYLFFFICCLVLALCFLIGIVCLIVQTFLLFGFYLVGPIVWAFYVWPYSASSGNDGSYSVNESGVKGFLATTTEKLNFGLFTAHRAGNIAPMGLLFNYTVIAGLTVAWGLIFWFISMIFLSTSGLPVDSGSTTYGTAELATGFPQATAALFGSETTDPITGLFGVSGSHTNGLRMLLSTVIAICAFVIMGRMLLKTFTETLQFQKTIAGRVANSIKNGISSPEGLASVAGKAANVLAKHGDKLPGAAGKIAKTVGKAAGGMDLAGKDGKGLAGGKGLAAKKPSLAAKQKADRAKLRNQLAAEGKSEGEIKKALQKQKADDKKALRESKAERLGEKLKELSTKEGAEKALAKKNALGSAIKLAENGHPLSAIGQALGANKSASQRQRQGELMSQKGITDNALNALKELRELGDAEREEKLRNLDPNVLQKLKDMKALGTDSSGKLALADPDKTRDIMKDLSLESNALNNELAWSRKSEEIRDNITTSLARGNSEVSTKLKALAPSAEDYKERAIGESTIRNVLASQGLADNAANRASVERQVLAAADGNATDIIEDNWRVAQGSSEKQASLAQKTVMNVLDRADEMGGTNAEKVEFVRNQLGEACDADEYVNRKRRLASGETLTQTELTELVAFEAQTKFSGKGLPASAFELYSENTARAQAVMRSSADYATAKTASEVVQLGALSNKHYDDNRNITSMPNFKFSDEANASDANMDMMKGAVNESLAQSGISEDQIAQFCDIVFGGQETLSDATKNFGKMVGKDPKKASEYIISQMADRQMKQSGAAEALAVAKKDAMEEKNRQIREYSRSGELGEETLQAINQTYQAAIDAAQANYDATKEMYREQAAQSIDGWDIPTMINAAAPGITGASRKVVMDTARQKVEEVQMFYDIVGGTKQAGDMYESAILSGAGIETRNGIHAMFAKRGAETAAEKRQVMEELKSAQIPADLEAIMNERGLDMSAIQQSVLVSDAAYEGLGKNDELFLAARTTLMMQGLNPDVRRDEIISGSALNNAMRDVAAATEDSIMSGFASGRSVDNVILLTQALDEHPNVELAENNRGTLMICMQEARTRGYDLDDTIERHANADYKTIFRNRPEGVLLPQGRDDMEFICAAIAGARRDLGENVFELYKGAELTERLSEYVPDAKRLADMPDFDSVVQSLADNPAVQETVMSFYDQYSDIRGAVDEMDLSQTVAEFRNPQVDHKARSEARARGGQPKQKTRTGTRTGKPGQKPLTGTRTGKSEPNTKGTANAPQRRQKRTK